MTYRPETPSAPTGSAGGGEPTHEPVELRLAHRDDADQIWAAATAAGELDDNSWYCYHLLCTHFADICAVAHDESGLVGFVTGFASGPDARTWFVWQLWVAPSRRRQSLAGALTQVILDHDPPRFTRVQATVDPDNHPSSAFFSDHGRRRSAALLVRPYLHADQFPPASSPHGREDLLTLELDD